jgi:hypothetical protein
MRLIYIADRTQRSGSEAGEAHPDPGATTVPESRVRISAVFAFLTVLCAAALTGGESGAHTAAGRTAVAVIFGGLLVVLVVGWIVTVRRPRRLKTVPAARRSAAG